MAREIRTLTADQVETLVGWAAAEGWNPGLGDAAAFRAADPDGFLGVFVDDEFVAGVSAVAYGTDFGFIGLYICRPEYRGQGHGRAVWDAGMARLAGRTVGLDGVPEQQANYSRMGFAKAYETIRMSGRPGFEATGTTTVRPPIERLAALDRRCFPADRTAFLEAWIQPPRLLRVHIEEGEVTGYGVLRRCLEGYKVGPLFAGSADVATAILADLCEAADGPVQIDVPLTQPGFLARLEATGMTPGFSTARMYLGPFPTVDTARIFGITTLELG